MMPKRPKRSPPRGTPAWWSRQLVQLQTNNAGRATLYRELGRQVKGDQIVGEVLDAEQFKSIVHRVGDVKELSKLFA
jgi:hypothetical protein